MFVQSLLPYTLLYFVWLYVSQTVVSLQITEFFVPRQAHQIASLDCKYSLKSNETIYDVKWYKDGLEFFRCKPNGSTLQFVVEGVKVSNLSKSAKPGMCSLKLVEVSEKTTGNYSCEVSLEFPFNSKSMKSLLNYVNTTVKEDSFMFIGDPDFMKYYINKTRHSNGSSVLSMNQIHLVISIIFSIITNK